MPFEPSSPIKPIISKDASLGINAATSRLWDTEDLEVDSDSAETVSHWKAVQNFFWDRSKRTLLGVRYNKWLFLCVILPVFFAFCLAVFLSIIYSYRAVEEALFTLPFYNKSVAFSWPWLKRT